MIARYLQLHVRTFAAALGRIGGTPLGGALNILVVAIALALPTALQILIENARGIGPRLDDAADFTLYLELDVDEDRGRDLSDAIASRSDVQAAEFISKVEGLAELRERANFGGALDSLSENPLPHAIRVRPATTAIDEVAALAESLETIDEVFVVQLDRGWVERLNAILVLVGRTANLVTFLLGAAVILVIGNTIRLEINNRRTEIEVLKLVGATDGFIRRPFLYMGLCLGGIGAVVAALMIGIGLVLLYRPIRDLAAVYASDFSLQGLSLEGLGILIGGGALLGWAGAWLAAARHLKTIEPA